MQKEEYLIKNACYSVTKYYLCKRNNKRSLSGRKQRLEVVRSFPNRYQFSCINKVTSLFSNRYIFIIILHCNILNKEHGTTKCGIIYKVYCHRILMLNLVETRCSGIMVWCAFCFLDMANTLQNGV